MCLVLKGILYSHNISLRLLTIPCLLKNHLLGMVSLLHWLLIDLGFGALSPGLFLLSFSSHLTAPCSYGALTFRLHGPFSIYIFTLPGELDPPPPPVPATDIEITSQLTPFWFSSPSLNHLGFSMGLAVPRGPHTVIDLTPLCYRQVTPPKLTNRKRVRRAEAKSQGNVEATAKFPSFTRGETSPTPIPLGEKAL